MRGASDFVLGASELRLGGASETLLSGASETDCAGSERALAMGA